MNSFRWFVLLVWGVLLNTQPPAVTSYLNAIGPGAGYYAQAGSYIVFDAYFACEPVMTRFCRHQVHLISRVRCPTAAYTERRQPPDTTALVG